MIPLPAILALLGCIFPCKSQDVPSQLPGASQLSANLQPNIQVQPTLVIPAPMQNIPQQLPANLQPNIQVQPPLIIPAPPSNPVLSPTLPIAVQPLPVIQPQPLFPVDSNYGPGIVSPGLPMIVQPMPVIEPVLPPQANLPAVQVVHPLVTYKPWNRRQLRTVQRSINVCLRPPIEPLIRPFNFREMTQRNFFCDSSGQNTDLMIDLFANCVRQNIRNPPPMFDPEGISFWKWSIKQAFGFGSNSCRNISFGRNAGGQEYRMGDSRNVFWLSLAVGFDPTSQALKTAGVDEVIHVCTKWHQTSTAHRYYCLGWQPNERNLEEFRRCLVERGVNYKRQLEESYDHLKREVGALCTTTNAKLQRFLIQQHLWRFAVPLACYVLDQEMRIANDEAKCYSRGTTNPHSNPAIRTRDVYRISFRNA